MSTVLPASLKDWSKNDVIIDINKGYSLHRLGVYSPNLVEEVIHTFIPLSKFCSSSPQTDVCQYASAPIDKNIALLTTMMSSNNMVHRITAYDSESVSKRIGDDMIRVLAEHHPDNIIRDTKSIAHFVNNNFFFNKTIVDTFTTTSPTNTNSNNRIITRMRSNSIEKFLKQISINTNKLGFEFLSNNDLIIFLTAAFSTIDIHHTISNVKESLDIFFQCVVGQSAFALRYCSLVQQNSPPSEPCITISTLFLRVPPDVPAKYSVYHLTPLPVIYNNEMYAYTNLPEIIGVDPIDKRIIIWNDNNEMKQCTFSRTVLCKKAPISTTITEPSCLSQLLDSAQLTTNMCQVIRSKNIQRDFMQIDENYFISFNIRNPQEYQIYLNSDDATETISINEPALVNVPCNNPFEYIGSQMLITPCASQKTLVATRIRSYFGTQTRILLPIRGMTKMIVSSYQSQFNDTIKDLMEALSSKKSFKQISEGILTYIISFITLALVIIMLYFFKLAKLKFKDINYLRSTIDTILSL